MPLLNAIKVLFTLSDESANKTLIAYSAGGWCGFTPEIC